jgi:hypothetical protein
MSPLTIPFGLALLLPIAVADAQARQASDTTCVAAERVIASGRIPDSNQPASLTLSRCGRTGGAAVARGLVRLRSERDSAAIQRFMTVADGWRDARVMTAAVEVAEDRTATVPSRLFAIRHLLALLKPYHVYEVRELARGADSSFDARTRIWTYTVGCERGIASAPKGANEGTPLPANARGIIRASLARIEADTESPREIRNAARCGRT